MKIAVEQIERHLAGRLAPVYLLSGNEILLVEEAGDRIRAAVRRFGCIEREVFHVARGFDWELLTRSCANLSLFSESRLFEIRLPTGKPGTEGSKALVTLSSQLPPNIIFLFFCPSLDAATQKSAWVTSLERAGVWVSVRSVEIAALPGWIGTRMRSRGLQPDIEATRLLADRIEGNLLAGAQEIEKLLLLHGAGAINSTAVESVVSDSARFEASSLSEACLAGDGIHAMRIFYSLRAGNEVALLLLLWTVVREIRSLATLGAEIERGSHIDQALSKIWERRRNLLEKALHRINTRKSEELLRQAARIDRCIKGSLPSDPWEEMMNLVLSFSGIRPDSSIPRS